MQLLEPRLSTGPSNQQTMFSKHRWTVLVTVPIALLALLWASLVLQPQPTAQALLPPSSTVAYVGCASFPELQPNYSDPSVAIMTLGPGSELNICPGTYFTGVNLSTMQSIGDITVQRVPTKTGDVNITPSLEPAIYITDSEEFVGNVWIYNINVSSGDEPGIQLGQDDFDTCCPGFSYVGGSVVISNVVATASGLEGVLINATEHISIFSSSGISNAKENFELNIVPPFQVGSNEEVEILEIAVMTPSIYLTDVVALYSDNDDGIYIGSYLDSDKYVESVDVQNGYVSIPIFDLYIDQTIADENHENGIQIKSLGNITIKNTEAISNGDDECCSEFGSGILVNFGQLISNNLLVACSMPSPNKIVYENVTTNENTRWGIGTRGIMHDIYFSGVTANQNGFDGVGAFTTDDIICPFLYGHIFVEDSQAHENGDGPLLFGEEVAAADEFIIQDSYDGDGFGGFRLMASEIYVSDSTSANDNDTFGFCLANETFFGPSLPGGIISVEDVLAEGNGSSGVVKSINCSEGLYFFGPNKLPFPVIDGPIQGEGEEMSLTGSFFITNSTAISNSDAGIWIDIIETSPYLKQQFTSGLTNHYVENVTTIGNEVGIDINRIDGFFLDSVALDHTVEIDQLVPLTPSMVYIQDSLIRANEFYGIQIDQTIGGLRQRSVGATAAITPTEVISQNIICRNGIGLGTTFSDDQNIPAGDVEAQAPLPIPEGVMVDARGNWWGDVTGPQVTPGNPDGEGNSIVTQSEDIFLPTLEIEGMVLYEPWINVLIALAQPNPTLPGLPVDLTFQYTEDGMTYYLADGIGDPNNPPIFILRTDNGTIDGSNDVGKYIVDSEITGELIPTSAGQAVVVLAGPCDLSQEIIVQVATPSVDIQKTPDVQVVPVNSDATFTISVQNTGDITLTEVAVTDTAAPDCVRTVGSLGDLAPGEVTSYTCTQQATGDFVNTADVAAYPLVGETAYTEIEYTDSDDAEVFVADIGLEKTVYVNGYGPDCPVDSTIKVPVSSTVKYCYTVTNNGGYTLTSHSLVDDQLGTLFTGFAQDLPPGASYSTVQAGLSITDTLFVTTTNVATWTASFVGTGELEGVGVEVDASNTAVVNISSGSDDQDNDGIPDNIEGTGDIDGDGIPDFLDPDVPTGLEPGEQPNAPGDNTLFLPSLSQP